MNNSIFKVQSKIEQIFAYNSSDPNWKKYIFELIIFGYKNALSCIFPVSVFALLALSKMIHIPGLPRYDFLLIACILVQTFMMLTRMESRDELLVICLFHLLGVSMEWYKVAHHSWTYPEFAYTKFFGVPVYSGFMYASVASFMCQAWRRFDLQLKHWPANWKTWLLAALIYFNFYTHHYIGDYRWYLFAAVFIVFYKSDIYFTNNGPTRKMKVSLSFVLIGFFIWLAENIATFFGAWKYANQHAGWQAVSMQKIGSWILMTIVSYIIVGQLKLTKNIANV